MWLFHGNWTAGPPARAHAGASKQRVTRRPFTQQPRQRGGGRGRRRVRLWLWVTLRWWGGVKDNGEAKTQHWKRQTNFISAAYLFIYPASFSGVSFCWHTILTSLPSLCCCCCFFSVTVALVADVLTASTASYGLEGKCKQLWCRPPVFLSALVLPQQLRPLVDSFWIWRPKNKKNICIYIFLALTPRFSASRGKTIGRKHSPVCRRASTIRITAPHWNVCVFPHARHPVLPVDVVGSLQFISIHTLQCGFLFIFYPLDVVNVSCFGTLNDPTLLQDVFLSLRPRIKLIRWRPQ